MNVRYQNNEIGYSALRGFHAHRACLKLPKLQHKNKFIFHVEIIIRIIVFVEERDVIKIDINIQLIPSQH